ncbi:MAG: carboxypeptidase-like regulatory domain-containing protein [Candidatus Methanoperedens sp.]|nr:carboxypeptidase-like regulatory domain-containing protein [Candidatus Methanoperedens sp.]
MTVNSFNTSLPAGQVQVNFTANITNGNNVNFTISTLVPNANYTIKRDGALYNISQADSSGTIRFNNSLWPDRTFTVEQVIEYGSAPGTSAHVNLTKIPNALVFLYTQAGTPYDFTLSAANGTFQFNNVPVGSYYVNVSKAGFVSNQTLVTVTAGTVNVGTLTMQYYDLNGDGRINILDLNSTGIDIYSQSMRRSNL